MEIIQSLLHFQGEKLSNNKGTYLLFLEVKEDITIEIGSLENNHFQESNYIYVGSALSPGRFKKRLDRHKRKEKKIF